MTRGSSDSSPVSLPSPGNPAAGATVFNFPSSESYSPEHYHSMEHKNAFEVGSVHN
jgi:hypothetical protein